MFQASAPFTAIGHAKVIGVDTVHDRHHHSNRSKIIEVAVAQHSCGRADQIRKNKNEEFEDIAVLELNSVQRFLFSPPHKNAISAKLPFQVVHFPPLPFTNATVYRIIVDKCSRMHTYLDEGVELLIVLKGALPEVQLHRGCNPLV